MFADHKRLVEWKNEMEALLVEWKFQFLQRKFQYCTMEVSGVEWKFRLCRIAMDGLYGLL